MNYNLKFIMKYFRFAEVFGENYFFQSADLNSQFALMIKSKNYDDWG